MPRFEGWIQYSEKPKLTSPQRIALASLPTMETGNLAGAQDKRMIVPRTLLKFVRESARVNGVSPWDVTEEIRIASARTPQERVAYEGRYHEKIGYVSDIHGGNETYVRALREFASAKHDMVIFEGDIIGTEYFTDLQRLYYDWLTNHSRNDILRRNPDVSDAELLSYGGAKVPEPGFTLKNGFLKLRRFELELAGKSAEDTDAQLSQLSDEEIAGEIRRYASYMHYGHYASNLPLTAKRTLAAGLKENAERILGAICMMQTHGTKVHVMEGNWEARSPIDFVSGTPDVIPLPKNERLFAAKQFFESNGVPFYDSLTVVETETTLHILLPFDAITDFSKTNPQVLATALERVKKARQEKKSVIMVSHGEPHYEIHYLASGTSTPLGEHTHIVNGMRQAVSSFRPDEIVYGHLHDLLTDEEGNTHDPNTKYALEITEDGLVPVARREAFSSEHVVASHIPLLKFAEVKVPKRSLNRSINGFGGIRQPTRIL